MPDILFKARLVICGFADNNEYDFHKIYALVTHLNNIKIMLSITVKFGLQVQHMDVTIVFLYGELQKTVYIEILEGIEIVHRKINVCKLHKSLYGLCVSLKRWCVR